MEFGISTHKLWYISYKQNQHVPMPIYQIQVHENRVIYQTEQKKY